jgi:hypothetical protein
MLDWRVDSQNLPPGWPQRPTTGSQAGEDDWAGYKHERAEILEFVRREKITGFPAMAGDRPRSRQESCRRVCRRGHWSPSAWSLSLHRFRHPGICEGSEYNIAKDNPLRGVYLHQAAGESRAQPAINFSVMHGVPASLATARSGDLQQALEERNAGSATSFLARGWRRPRVCRGVSEDQGNAAPSCVNLEQARLAPG